MLSILDTVHYGRSRNLHRGDSDETAKRLTEIEFYPGNSSDKKLRDRRVNLHIVVHIVNFTLLLILKRMPNGHCPFQLISVSAIRWRHHIQYDSTRMDWLAISSTDSAKFLMIMMLFHNN